MTTTKMDDDTLRRKIIGVWKLVSVTYEDVATKARTPALGALPRGRQIITAQGHWITLGTAEGRRTPMTDNERARGLQSMVAYTGHYRVADGKVITTIDAAWNEGWVGTEQVRYISFANDRLYVESPPMPHPNVNDRTMRVIVVWERDK